jgi:peptide/nickel transport system permease protein
MRNYIIRRVIYNIPALFLVSVFVFLMVRVMPGDAAALKMASVEDTTGNPALEQEVRHQLGLDRPYVVQYADWVYRIFRHGDFGSSYYSKRPVLEEIIERLPPTVELATGTIVVSVFFSILLGTISAIRQDTWLDYIVRVGNVWGQSIPHFWVATLVIVVPAFTWGYLPPVGYVSPLKDPLGNLQQFIGPWLSMGLGFSATTMRMTRSTMLEQLRQDYVRTAWAKGLRERSVVIRHALRNAMIPVVTLVGVSFGGLLGGTVTIEAVFVLPGLGLSTLNAITLRDYPQIQANVLFITTIFLSMNLVVDILYAWLDPRIRYS